MSTFLVPIDNADTDKSSITLGYQMAASFDAKLGLVLANGSSKLSAEHILGPGVDRLAGTYVLDVAPGQELLSWVKELEQPVIVLDTRAIAPGGERISPWIASNAGTTVTSLIGSDKLPAASIRRVMVPLEGSTEAEQILDLVVTIARRTGASVGLIRVVSDRDPGSPTGGRDSTRILTERDAARSYLDSVARQLRAQGVDVTWEVRIGGASEEIARAAATTAADLILMASRNFGEDLASGTFSVTDTTVSSSSLPVIVARVVTGTSG